MRQGGGKEGRKEKGWVYQVEMLLIAHTNTSLFLLLWCVTIPSVRFLTEEGSLVCRDDCALPHSELQVL